MGGPSSCESAFDKKIFSTAGKTVTLYPALQADRPLIVLNTYTGDGESVMRELRKAGAEDSNLLVIGNLDWNYDMTPWDCPPLSKKDTPAAGGADQYLALLLSEILPRAKKMVCGSPPRTCIAGYSLAGLFALYAMYRCDAFDRAAIISGSLWYPHFREFAAKHEMPRRHSHNLFCLPHFSGHYGCRSDHPARERAVPFDLAGKSQSARQLQDRDYGVHTKHPPAFATPLPGDL